MVRWLSVVLLLLCVGVRGAVAETDPRQDLLLRLNQERFRSGLPPLRLVPALSLAAQEHAEEIGRRRSNRPEPDGTEAMVARLQRVGYAAYTWNESILVANGGADQVVAQWRESNRRSARLSPSLRDVGIGISDYYGDPLYTLLFGWHLGDFFAQETAGLTDLEQVRADLLDRVNAARREAGRQPLLPSSNLNQAAQDHAQDLLARSYYGHLSPEGSSPLTRARAAGYPVEAIAENLHQLTGSVQQVMEGWLRSPAHRRNILDPFVSELGVGVAVGPGYGLDPSGYRVIWVQNFGRPARREEARTRGREIRTHGEAIRTDGEEPSTDGEELRTRGEASSTEREEPSTRGEASSTNGEEPRTEEGGTPYAEGGGPYARGGIKYARTSFRYVRTELPPVRTELLPLRATLPPVRTSFRYPGTGFSYVRTGI